MLTSPVHQYNHSDACVDSFQNNKGGYCELRNKNIIVLQDPLFDDYSILQTVWVFFFFFKLLTSFFQILLKGGAVQPARTLH